MTSTAEGDEARGASGPDPGTAYDLGRLYAFSDGVFAIAITILVLGIPIPNVQHSSQLLGALPSIVPNLLGFALSFVLVGAQWIAHHRLLRRLDFCDGRILQLNLLLLMGICLVPFASTLLARYGDSAAGAIPYAALQAAIGIVFMALRLYLLHHGVDLRTTLALSWVPIVVFVVSMPLALRSTDLTYAVWLAGFAVSRARGGAFVHHLLRRLTRRS
jgi:uncharacterized membrane protein